MSSNNIDVVKCNKCKQFIDKADTIKYNLVLRKENIVNNPLAYVILCKECDSQRRTTVTRYISI